MKKIGFVTPWFGEKIPGGAEAALREIIIHLKEAGFSLEVLTTCVKEFSADWNIDYYKPGEYRELNIPVLRFKVRKSNEKKFITVNNKLMNNVNISLKEEKIFCEEMINSPDLYNYMKKKQETYSLFIFIPYMFGTTFYGCQICPEKSILIPCFHDESYFYLKCFKKVFSSIKGMMFNSEPELLLTEKEYNLKKVYKKVLGLGMDTDISSDAQAFVEKFHINYPFVLYAGRKDKGKNIETLITYFSEYKHRNPSTLKLVLIGGGNVFIPEKMKEEIIDLGFVDIQDKYNAYAAAKVLCQPSIHESFSFVIMESWLCGRPVLVHEQCNVTQFFAKKSQGGLYFNNYFEFEGAISYILQNEEIASQMGENGRSFVKANFSWNIMVEKYKNFFRNCITE